MTLYAIYNNTRIAIDESGSPLYPPSYWTPEFIASIASLPRVEEPDPEPDPPEPDWINFNTAMLSDSNWQAWTLPADLRNAMIAASINANLTSLESAYAIAKATVPPSAEAIAGWQTLADTYNISIVF